MRISSLCTRLSAAASVVVLALLACTVGPKDRALAACPPSDSLRTIALVVTDRETGAPVHALYAHHQWLRMAKTDSSGVACLRVDSEDTATVVTERPGYATESVHVDLRAEAVVPVVLPVRRRARPCCDLNSRWSITMELDSARAGGRVPTRRRVDGFLDFGPNHVRVAGKAFASSDSIVQWVHGRHEVDFRPFFGGPVVWTASTSVSADGPDLLTEAVGVIPGGDSVVVLLIPRMSHGSLDLRGVIREDVVTGKWVQNDYCCGARGTFTMRRVKAASRSP